ncbi:MAG: ATP phosphoribosyltransferase regulatory subunit, partial [Actinomycetota bacterium]
RGDLSEQSLATMAVNPLRVLDSKRRQDQAIVAEAPVIVDYLSDDAAAAFERVQQGLKALGVPFELAPRLVRGLDYYTRTTFEYVATGLDAAQTAIGGGGRYDGLVEALGGPPEPGVGFALGVDRTLLACDAEEVFGPAATDVDVWVVATTPGTEALELAEELRVAGIRVDRSYAGPEGGPRSMKAQMKAANRSGARIAVIVGEEELEAGSVSLRMLRATDDSDEPQQALVARSQVVQKILEKVR